VATEHDLYKIIGDINVCAEFEMLKIKVPIIFLGTVGFSPPREGRYLLGGPVSFHTLTATLLPTAQLS
jgi:hypothetical protein